jgi:hypothetical protein
LLGFFSRGAEIHTAAFAEESGAFRTEVLFPESDHAPALAEFNRERSARNISAALRLAGGRYMYDRDHTIVGTTRIARHPVAK